MIFIAASWKERERVRRLADCLRGLGWPVYDFTDPACRKEPEIPPEKFPRFDPETDNYWEYVNRPEFCAAIAENRRHLDQCSFLVLLLPCGSDAQADWAYAVGKGKWTVIIGNPREGAASPTHLWGSVWFPDDESFLRTFMLSNFE